MRVNLGGGGMVIKALAGVGKRAGGGRQLRRQHLAGRWELGFRHLPRVLRMQRRQGKQQQGQPHKQVGRIWSSCTTARAGSFATARIISATSWGCNALASTSAEGFTGRLTRSSVSTSPGQTTQVRM